MRLNLFLAASIEDNGRLDAFANICFKPVRGVMQGIQGEQWNLRRFKVDLSKDIVEEIAQIRSAEGMAYKITKFIVSLFLALPGLFVGAALKGLAFLDSTVVAKYKLLTISEKDKSDATCYDPELIEIFGGLSKIKSLPVITLEGRTIDDLQPKDLGSHIMVKATIGAYQTLLVRYKATRNNEKGEGLYMFFKKTDSETWSFWDIYPSFLRGPRVYSICWRSDTKFFEDLVAAKLCSGDPGATYPDQNTIFYSLASANKDIF